MTTSDLNKKNENDNLIWILIDHDTYPSTIQGVYSSYNEVLSNMDDEIKDGVTPGVEIVCWDIINNMEVDYTKTDA